MAGAVLYSDLTQIRAALGLTALELSDEAILDLELDAFVETVLDESFPDHAEAISEADGGDAAQVKRGRMVRLLCAYETAVLLLPQLPAIMFQSISDGDASKTRFNRLEEMSKAVTDTRNELANRLSADPAMKPLNPIGISTPAYDPVEGC